MLQNIHSASLVGGAVAALAAGKLLLYTKYPRTWLLVCRRSAAYWRYVLYYGLLGTLFTEFIFRTEFGHPKFVIGIPRMIFWPIVAVFFGTLAKASIVAALTGAHHLHLGLRVGLLLFEPRLLEEIEAREYFALKRIVRKYASRWNLEELKRAIERNIPDRMESAQKLLFLENVQKQKAVDEAMILFYRFVGRDGFEFTFVEQAPARAMPSRPSEPRMKRPEDDIPIHPFIGDVTSKRRPPFDERQVR